MFSTTITNISQRGGYVRQTLGNRQLCSQKLLWHRDEDNLNNYLAAGYIAGLSDRYATYYTAADYTKKQQENAGKFTGIGIRASRSESGFIQVNEVYPDSPASEAGIKGG